MTMTTTVLDPSAGIADPCVVVDDYARPGPSSSSDSATATSCRASHRCRSTSTSGTCPSVPPTLRANFETTTCCGMTPPDKPRHRSGYTAEDSQHVRAVCLTVAVTLGACLDDICIVGGLVPSLLIDGLSSTDADHDRRHPGTNDLDIALAVSLLSDERYAEVGHRLRQEGFEPDVNANGNPTVQRWRLHGLQVTIDFLMAPLPG